MRKNIDEKIKLAREKGILIPEEVKENNIVCIYGLFAVNQEYKRCFYIGKTTNLRGRLLSSGGHVHNYLNGYVSKLVPKYINLHINNGDEVHIEILEEIDYFDESFSRAAHRLAYSELKYIVMYQKNGECLNQLPEGIGSNEFKYWESNYKKNI